MNRIIFTLLITIVMSCSSSKIVTLATQGETSKKIFNEEIPMHYIGNHIFIESKINGKNYTFLFDTGYDFTTFDKSLIDKIHFTSIKKKSTSGSSFQNEKLQYGVIPAINIGVIEFNNIAVGIQDLSHVKSPFPDGRRIDGIIGANILRKALWKIDYQKQSLRFSNTIKNFPPDTNAIKIDMIPKSSSNWGLNRIKVNINGVSENFVFDTGSHGSFSANNEFLARLNDKAFSLLEIVDSLDSKKRKFQITELKLDMHVFHNQELFIEKDIDLLIGNDFLDEYTVIIDWLNNELYLQ